MQTLMLDTIVGKKPVLAPSGWEFDKTAKIAWARLLRLAREERAKRFRTQRDRLIHVGQMEVLAIVLANSIGMASFYWLKEARTISATDGAC